MLQKVKIALSPTLASLRGRLGRRTVQGTVAWVFGSYVVSALTATAVQILQARLVSVPELGRLATAMAVSLIFEGIITARGADTALAFFANNRHRSARFLGRALFELLLIDFIWTALCVALFILGLAATQRFFHVSVLLIALFALGTLAQFAWSTGKNAIIVIEPTRRTAQVELMGATLTGLCGGAGLICGGIVGYAYSMIIAGALRSIVSTQVLQRQLHLRFKIITSFRTVSWTLFHRLGVLALMRSIAGVIAGQLDILLLATSAPLSMIAYYRVSKSCASIPGKVLAPIWTVARKSIIHGVTREGLQDTRKAIVLAASFLMCLGIPVFLGSTFFGVKLLSLLFGQKYAGTEAASCLSVLMPSLWFLTLATGWNRFIAAVAPRKGMMTLTFIAQCLACGILWLIIRPNDALGMADITAIVSVATAIGFWIILFNERWLLVRKDEVVTQ